MRSILRNIYLQVFGVGKSPKPGIHIINSHFITPYGVNVNDELVLEGFLNHLTKKCRLISLQEATHLILHDLAPSNEALISLTFDDGFEECYTVIAPLLEKYNCRGTFFINSNYVESNESYQGKFHDRIKTYTKKPMTWHQIKELHQRGHLIGSHTLDHLNMANICEEELEYQLVENKKKLEAKLDFTCDYFAWPYGQIQHFSELALQHALNYHKYVFSGTDYKRYLSMDGKVFNRRHIEPFWNKTHINYFLSVKKSK